MREVQLISKTIRQVLTRLDKVMEGRRRALMRARRRFLYELPGPHSVIRQSEWRVRPLPSSLQQRHVEITGPADPKIIINALHSGADAFMADLEDAATPHWEVQMRGQTALYHAARGQLLYESPEGALLHKWGWRVIERR